MPVLHTLWEPRRRIEQSYYRSLLTVTDFLTATGWNGADPYDLVGRLRSLVTAPFWVRYAEQAARSMVTMLFVDGARDWRHAASESSRGREIYAALSNELAGPVGSAFYAEIGRNADLIRTLPADIAARVTDYVAEETLKGRRAESLEEEIAAMFPRATHAKAQLIARTETSKTATALTRARAESIGLDAYIWRTSEDARVRKSHRHMDGVTVFWNDPPSPERLIGEKNPPPPYHGGCIWQCRCYPEPITDIDHIHWPHKTYIGGVIRQLRRQQFTEML